MQRIYEAHAYTNAPRQDCYWAPPPQDYPLFEGQAKTEFAIIGGGYTGLSAALELAKHGADITLLEAHAPGWGASGRNGGFCCFGGSALGPEATIRRFGKTAADEFFNIERAAIDLVAEILQTHAINADTHSDGEVLLAHRPGAIKTLREEAEFFSAKGIANRLIPQNALRQEGLAGPFHGGLHISLGFALDPAKYAHGLARAAAHAGANICANSPVTSIERHNGHFVLTTPKGCLTAKKLIIATNGYSSENVPNQLAGRFLPLQSNIIVTRPLSIQERADAGWTSDYMAYDSRILLHYFRLLPDGRMLFGRRGALRAGPHDQAAMRRTVIKHFHAMFPAWRHIEIPHFWSGFVNLAADRMPHITQLQGWDGAWTAMAYHGNGVAMASWAGRQVARAALDGTAIPAAMARPLPRWPLGRARRILLAPALGWYMFHDRFL